MRNSLVLLVAGFAACQLTGCATTSTRDLAHDPFPEAQAELREVLATILRDAQTGNAVGLRDGHLKSDKFTKFGGRKYERLDFEQTVAGETANITTGQEYTYDVKDLKIDVFGAVAIMTFYGQVSRTVDGDPVEYTFRQTLAFLDTPDGWKIIHEHQSKKEYDAAHHPYREAQAEVREALWKMIRDAEKADVVDSREAHLDSEKFTKFGIRRYKRQSFEQCIESETANLTSLDNLNYKPRDLKIDVFGDVAVVTYYPHYTARRNGKSVQGSGRQTLVYVKTPNGWKIAHEHHSSKTGFER